MIVGVEGPSAAGKTTWCRRVADRFVGEYEPTGREPVGDDLEVQARYWTKINADRWSEAIEVERMDGLALCDSDPLKLHYSWCLARIGAAPRSRFSQEHREVRRAMRQQRLGFVDAVVVGLPDEGTLRIQKDGDKTRTRSSFDLHLLLRTPLEEWYRGIDALDPGRVSWGFPTALPDDFTSVGPRRDRYDVELLDALIQGLPAL